MAIPNSYHRHTGPAPRDEPRNNARFGLDGVILPWSPDVLNGVFPSFQDISSQHMGSLTMIGVLIFPDFQLLDAAGPISVFEIAARLTGQAPDIKALAVTPGAVRSSSG